MIYCMTAKMDFEGNAAPLYSLIDVITECYDNINSGNLSCVTALDIKKHLIRLVLTYCFTNWTIMVYVVHVTNSLIVI